MIVFLHDCVCTWGLIIIFTFVLCIYFVESINSDDYYNLIGSVKFYRTHKNLPSVTSDTESSCSGWFVGTKMYVHIPTDNNSLVPRLTLKIISQMCTENYWR